MPHDLTPQHSAHPDAVPTQGTVTDEAGAAANAGTMHATVVRGARTHNLKGVDLELRPGELVAFTGVSGAGKSSLAVDTLYAEGQRRFVESFSPYARQFLERLDRPPADKVEPVAAAVAVDRKAPVKSSRSTVATMAELEPYLAALFSREARPVCPDCDVEAVESDAHASMERAIEEISRADVKGSRALVTYPMRVAGAEDYLLLREGLAREGLRRVRLGGALRTIDDVAPSEAQAAPLEVVVDRIALDDVHAERARLREAIERAWSHGAGRAHIVISGADAASASASDPVITVARGLSCPSCARSFEAAKPGLFSFNNPAGACAKCRGFGRTIGIDWRKVVPDPRRTINGGVLRAWAGKSAQWERGELRKLCAREGIAMNVPWRDLPEAQRTLILEGEPGGYEANKFPGVRGWFKYLESRTYKMHVRVFLARFRAYDPCVECGGARLNETSRRYRVGGLSLADWQRLSVAGAHALLEATQCRDAGGARAKEILAGRLRYLEAVGLGHLSLDRQARTLSGGEAQRVGLTAALGTSLVGALFVVDEPTVGLHVADVPPLIDALQALARAGNAVVVIEHDPRVVAACDRVVEFGPGAGPHGGNILFQGTPAQLAARPDLPSGPALAGDRAHAKQSRRRPARGVLTIKNAHGNNLKHVDVTIPLGVLCAITGPSGSGKSTIVGDILAPAAQLATGDVSGEAPLAHDGIEGLGAIDRVVYVDQSPLGRTSRGNAATYTKSWDHVRALFASQGVRDDGGPQLDAAHFSFNTDEGRCATCGGEGFETVEMQFLADVAIRCPVCQGRRFNDDVLAVTMLGKNVAEVLGFTVDEAIAFAELGKEATKGGTRTRWTRFAESLEPLHDVGLGYLPLGQPLSTLSGGEAQRLKLARALAEVWESGPLVSKRRTTLVIVDEPSVGLHARDVAKVIDALQILVDRGASCVVVEHDLDLIAVADHVIDLGPGGGSDGGSVVATGTVEEVAATNTRTGVALHAHLQPNHALVGARKGCSAPASASPLANVIAVRHAREHNLKDISIDIPRGKLVVVTGPSGSGKSTFAFDVVFAEGQRRFLETLSPYARQFLPMLPRPDVEAVLGVPPSIALEQRTTRGGRTSTVATVTEAAHYLRLLYAKIGTPHCPKCDTAIVASTPDAILARIHGSGSAPQKAEKKAKAKRAMVLLSPAIRARKGTHLDVLTHATRAGYTHARVDGAIVAIDPPAKLLKTKEHTIELVAFAGDRHAVTIEKVRDALARGDRQVIVAEAELDKAGVPKALFDEQVLSTARACPTCGIGVPELDPRWFSFNTKQGQCATCLGTGLTIADGEDEGDEPTTVCADCAGTRLGPIPRRVQLDGETYAEMTARPVDAALARVRALGAVVARDETTRALGLAPLTELTRRLEFLVKVGLTYLSLDRPARTLSGGEMQRLRLAAQLGSGLTGALYVLDEPTIGLHPRDTQRLIENLRALVDTGSTVMVVEHDADTIRAADFLLDIGPRGGKGGGRIIASGSPASVIAHAESPTGHAFRDTTVPAPPKRDGAPKQWIELRGASGHNLHKVDLRIPIGRMTVVAGVSGSGKSTLVRQVFYPAVRRALKLESPEPLAFDKLLGMKGLTRALAVDQTPIGRTPRSVPATFLGIFDLIRKLFAQTPDAQVRGYLPARFSFNGGGGGRCSACEGSGVIVSEMSFMPDVVSPCEACNGMRYEPATLDVKFLGKSIGEVLKLTAQDAAELFSAHSMIARPLRILDELGVGYVAIGQGSNTLSGGEAQRLKLASELGEMMKHVPTLYVLDEPTTGLHLSDVRRLLGVCQKLIDRGDTLVVVEHHPEVIASADHVVELGPEGGVGGGRIVAEGTPREIAKRQTATGKVLRDLGVS